MYRDIFTNKWIIRGIATLIIVGGACFLWYKYDTAADRKAATDAEKLLRQWEITQKGSDTDSETELAAGESVDSIRQNAEKPIIETTPVTENTEPTQAQNENETSTANAEVSEERVSPFGFGPYPVVPEDYPIPPSRFKWEFWGKTLRHELMSRVCIKLWKQGVRSDGATFRNGKVYPTILGTVYVEWKEDYISGMSGHPDDDFDAIEAALEAGQPPPEGITVLNRSEAGIDPYNFLELNKKE